MPHRFDRPPRAWSDEAGPDDWGLGILVHILKNGDKTRCEKYRGISLIDVSAKIFALVLLRRLQAVPDTRTRPNQAGLRAGHSYQQLTAVRFIDFSAAFDSVDRQSLWRIMVLNAVPANIIAMIKAYYRSTTAGILVRNNLSQSFGIKSGVRQGCILSSILFIWILERALHESDGVEFAPGHRLSDLDYADDIALLISSFGDLQSMVSRMKEVAKLLLELCLRTYFTFDWTIYEQVKGTPMGSPISGFIAEAVLQRLESLVFQHHKPKFWTRYVDNTFVVNDRDQLLTFKECLNAVFPDIQFAMEEEENNQLAFLLFYTATRWEGGGECVRCSRNLLTLETTSHPSGLAHSMANQDTQSFEDKGAVVRCLPELNSLRMTGELTDMTIEPQDEANLETQSFEDEVALSRCLPELNNLRMTGELTDMIIELQDKVSLQVHRVARPLIDYVYTGQLEVNEANATGLIVLSQQLVMPQVEEWAVSFMAARFNSENIKNYWDLAELLKSEQLMNSCLHHIKENFEATVASDLFIQLPADTVLSILRADDLIVDSEEIVFKSIGLWTEPRPGDADAVTHPVSQTVIIVWGDAHMDNLTWVSSPVEAVTGGVAARHSIASGSHRWESDASKWTLGVVFTCKQLTEDQVKVLQRESSYNTGDAQPVDFIAALEATLSKTDTTEDSKNAIRQRVASLIMSHRPRRTIPPAEVKAIKELKRDEEIVIVPSDKGRATVVLDKSEYVTKAQQLLMTNNRIKSSTPTP
nr:unnamed protein product [Spirometra erinaceieuropaei]